MSFENSEIRIKFYSKYEKEFTIRGNLISINEKYCGYDFIQLFPDVCEKKILRVSSKRGSDEEIILKVKNHSETISKINLGNITPMQFGLLIRDFVKKCECRGCEVELGCCIFIELLSFINSITQSHLDYQGDAYMVGFSPWRTLGGKSNFYSTLFSASFGNFFCWIPWNFLGGGWPVTVPVLIGTVVMKKK